MAQGYVTDGLSNGEYRAEVNARLTAIEKRAAKTTQGYLLPTSSIAYFDEQLSGYTNSTLFVTMLEGEIQKLVRPAILIGWIPVPLGGAGFINTNECFDIFGPLTYPTAEYRLRLRNSSGIDVGNSPTAVRTLTYPVVPLDNGWFWNHGVELWQDETYKISVEARLTSGGANAVVKIAMPINGFDQTGLTIPGSRDTTGVFIDYCSTAKGSIYRGLGFDCGVGNDSFRATTDGLGS